MINKKSSKNYKKIIILFLIGILLFILIFSIIKFHSKEQILNKLITGLNNLNYEYTLKDGEIKVEICGKLEKRTTSDVIKYLDYEKNITYEVFVDTGYMEEYKNNGISDISYYNNYINCYFNNDEYKYKYVGKKEMNGKKYIVIKFVDNIIGKNETYFWIDDATNVIKKIEYYQEKNNKLEKSDEITFNFDNGSNKLEDVKFSKELLTEYSSDTNN